MNIVRKIDSNGTITTWAGDGDNFNDQPDAVQFRTDTNIGGPRSIVFDSTGNAFIASEYWNLILKVDTSGNVTRFSGNPY